MTLLVFILSILFTVLATVILAYVSMVTMIGPWFAPTIALVGGFIIRKLYPKSTDHATQHAVAVIQAIAAGGGTIAVGVGFALPMLYFLDPIVFTQLISQPILFMSLMGLTVLVAGSFGIFLGVQFADSLINQQRLPFPSSSLTFNVISAQGQALQTKLLALGFSLSTVTCFMRDGFLYWKSIIPQSVIFGHLLGGELSLALSPMIGAIGFSAGKLIALPLIIGIFTKFFVSGLYQLADRCIGLSLPPVTTVFMGFCSGLLVAEIIAGLKLKNIKLSTFLDFWFLKKSFYFQLMVRLATNRKVMGYGACVGFISMAFLLLCGFNFFAGLLFLLLTSVATYHICLMSGHIGMVQFGRFSTFIMIFLFLLFALNPVHLTMICLFFHICAATASDYLFDYNIFRLGGYSKKSLAAYQFFGLLITACSLGLVLWVLFTHLQLGSPELFAQRGKTKALLIQTLSFDPYMLAGGIFYGLTLKRYRISPAMTLGGLLMPSSLVFSLLGGSLLSCLPKKKERFAPLCAGILTGESMFVIASIIIKLFM